MEPSNFENRTTISAADMEQNLGDESLRTQKFEAYDSPVSIHVHSIRKGLCDADGVSAKATIDGLVRAGILEDDSTRFVKEVTFSQEEGEPEKTIVEIIEL